MFHLIGLAQAKRLPSVLHALGERGIAARGLFGESSRAVGAFVQVSVIGGSRHDFIGACAGQRPSMAFPTDPLHVMGVAFEGFDLFAGFEIEDAEEFVSAA